MLNAILSIVSLAVVALAVAVVHAARVLSHNIPRPEPAPHRGISEDEFAEVKDELTKLRTEQGRLTIAISEGIARVDRHEKRVQRTVTSARRLVRESGLEHAQIEAEFAELEGQRSDELDQGTEPPVVTQPAAPVEGNRTIRFPGGTLEIGAA